MPPILEVYPEMKWYRVCSGVNREIGGMIPNASAVNIIIFSGCPPIFERSAVGIWVIGYAALVFSVKLASFKSIRLVSMLKETFSRIVPNFLVHS